MNQQTLKRETKTTIESFSWRARKSDDELTPSLLERRFDAEMGALMNVYRIYLRKKIDFNVPEGEVFTQFERLANSLTDAISCLDENRAGEINVITFPWKNPVYKQMRNTEEDKTNNDS